LKQTLVIEPQMAALGRTRPDGHLVFSMAAAQVLKGSSLPDGEDLLA